MGRAFEFRKERKFKRWAGMAKTFTRLGREIAIAVKNGGPDPLIIPPSDSPSIMPKLLICPRQT